MKDTCCSTITSAVTRARSLFSAMPARSCLHTKRPSKSVVADLHTPDKQRCFDGWWCPQWVPQLSCIKQRSRYDPERGRQTFDVPTRMTRGVLLHTRPFSHKTENTVAGFTHVPEVRADELWRVQEETEIRKPVKGPPATSLFLPDTTVFIFHHQFCHCSSPLDNNSMLSKPPHVQLLVLKMFLRSCCRCWRVKFVSAGSAAALAAGSLPPSFAVTVAAAAAPLAVAVGSLPTATAVAPPAARTIDVVSSQQLRRFHGSVRLW